MADKEQFKQIEQVVDIYYGVNAAAADSQSAFSKSNLSKTTKGKIPKPLDVGGKFGSKKDNEILDIIKEVRETNIKDMDPAFKRSKKTKDKNFEVFKEYNRKLLSFPTANDPFMAHKRMQYKKL